MYRKSGEVNRCYGNAPQAEWKGPHNLNARSFLHQRFARGFEIFAFLSVDLWISESQTFQSFDDCRGNHQMREPFIVRRKNLRMTVPLRAMCRSKQRISSKRSSQMCFVTRDGGSFSFLSTLGCTLTTKTSS